MKPFLKSRHVPGQLVAYLPDVDCDVMAEIMVAFANADGGTLLVGVDGQGQPVGHVSVDDVEAALRQAEDRCSPAIPTGWETMSEADSTVVAISVPRSIDLHSLKDGRVVVRQGPHNKALTGEAIRQLATTKSSSDFETEMVPGARRSDLDETIVAEYQIQRQQRGRPYMGSVEEMLTDIGALTPNGQPTTIGILLFGKSPQVFLPQSGLTLVKFLGTEPRGEGGLPGYGRREEIGGSLARIIERTWQVVYEEMHVGAVVKGLKREDKTEYPRFAVREALVNAVCHRDYRIKGRRIEVRMFSDRLEVISPGSLPGFITVDNIVEEHFSRNPRLVAGLFQWGYIEELGLGIDRMIEEMAQAGHPAPQFKALLHSFTVSLSNVRERRRTPSWQHSMNERQTRAIQYVHDFQRITNRDYQRLCPDVSSETLRLDLVDLVDRGILLRVGAKKGTYYILK
jgi:ATP-dependent DNA helicase RecG